MTLLKSHQVAGLVVGSAVDPATIEDANPLEGQGAQGGLMAHAASAAGVVEGLGPERSRYGLPDPLDEGLTQEGGAGPAPVRWTPLFGPKARGLKVEPAPIPRSSKNTSPSSSSSGTRLQSSTETTTLLDAIRGGSRGRLTTWEERREAGENITLTPRC